MVEVLTITFKNSVHDNNIVELNLYIKATL
jgi:hypothetical protein